MSVIEKMKADIISIGEAIDRYKEERPDPVRNQQIINGSVKKLNMENTLVKLIEGSDLHMKCGCGFESAACNFEFGISIQDCNTCGNHVQLEVSCPECGKTKIVYKDNLYEGD